MQWASFKWLHSTVITRSQHIWESLWKGWECSAERWSLQIRTVRPVSIFHQWSEKTMGVVRDLTTQKDRLKYILGSRKFNTEENLAGGFWKEGTLFHAYPCASFHVYVCFLTNTEGEPEQPGFPCWLLSHQQMPNRMRGISSKGATCKDTAGPGEPQAHGGEWPGLGRESLKRQTWGPSGRGLGRKVTVLPALPASWAESTPTRRAWGQRLLAARKPVSRGGVWWGGYWGASRCATPGTRLCR